MKNKPTTDAECDSLYKKLLANKLFIIDDDSKLPKCNESKEIINSKEEIVTHSVEDGSEYHLWIITPSKTRYLYYYSPESFAQYCPQNKDRQNILKIIDLFKTAW